MAGPAAVEIKGLAEFRRALKAIGPEWPKAMRLAHKQISTDVARTAQGISAGMGGVHAKAAGLIKGYASGTQASVGVPSGIGGAAEWGTLRHTGWYAAARYRASSGRQHPPWVGSSWEPGVAGQGPYAINSALAGDLDQVVEAFMHAIDDLTANAFPN